MSDKQKKRELKLGGCEIKPDNPTKYCLSCHKDFDQLRHCAYFVKKLYFVITGFFCIDLSFDIQASGNGYKLIYIKSGYGDKNIEKIKEIHFTLTEWDEIWSKISNCYVFDWNNEYDDKNVINVPNWELVIESVTEVPDGIVQSKRIIGKNQYPVYFNNLLKIFSTIVEEKFAQ